MDHYPSQHTRTKGFSVGSPQQAGGKHGMHPSRSRIGHHVGRATTPRGALFDKKT